MTMTIRELYVSVIALSELITHREVELMCKHINSDKPFEAKSLNDYVTELEILADVEFTTTERKWIMAEHKRRFGEYK